MYWSRSIQYHKMVSWSDRKWIFNIAPLLTCLTLGLMHVLEFVHRCSSRSGPWNEVSVPSLRLMCQYLYTWLHHHKFPCKRVYTNSTWRASSSDSNGLLIMHTNSILPSLTLVCWQWRSTPSLPSWLSRHRDATGDRIMHFSWGSECECAHFSCSVLGYVLLCQ